MSYLITSNTALTNVQFPTQDGMNNPSSYINQLQETHEIPANSEIALSSIKISKDGLISLNRNNNKIYTYYGEELSVINKTQSKVTSAPIQAYITEDLTSPQQQISYNVDELAQVTQSSLRRAMFHPMLQISNMNTSSVEVTPKRNASDTGFEGYEICVTSATNASNDDTKISANWQPATLAQDGQGYESATGELDNPGSDAVLTLIGTDYPLSAVGGEFDINIEDLVNESLLDADWRVGLSRCTRFKTVTGGTAPVQESPSWFEDNNGGALGGGGETFFDYVAQSEVVAGKTLLKLYQALYDNATEELKMVEFDYRQSRTGAKDYVDMNASDVDNIIWTITGEQVKCQIVSNSTTETLVTGTNASATLNLKPVNQNMWCLFPKVAIPGAAVFEVEKFDGVDITGWKYGGEQLSAITGRAEQVYCDWYAQNINLGGNRDISFCKPIDARYMNVIGNTTAYTQIGLAGTNTVNFKSIFILAESTLYKPTRFASTGRLLGFPNRSVLSAPTTQAGSKVCYVSDTVPQMISTGSLFVRLKNMTFSSFNMSKGSSSKILYHLPRFDNGGSEFGALFFEPNERMYLKLNNVNPIMLNDIHVELVEPDERIAKNLTGKTIVCFHIRESK